MDTIHFRRHGDINLHPISKKEWHMKGVPPMKTIAEAISWGMSDNTHIVTPEEWLKMMPLVHES